MASAPPTGAALVAGSCSPDRGWKQESSEHQAALGHCQGLCKPGQEVPRRKGQLEAVSCGNTSPNKCLQSTRNPDSPVRCCQKQHQEGTTISLKNISSLSAFRCSTSQQSCEGISQPQNISSTDGQGTELPGGFCTEKATQWF